MMLVMTGEQLVKELEELGFKRKVLFLSKDIKEGFVCVTFNLLLKVCFIRTYDNKENIILRETLTYQETLNKFKNEK